MAPRRTEGQLSGGRRSGEGGGPNLRARSKGGASAAAGPTFRVLVVHEAEDLQGLLDRAVDGVQSFAVEAVLVADAPAAVAELERDRFDAVIVDEGIDGSGGVELLVMVHRKWPETVRMLLTGPDRLGRVLEAMERGIVHGFTERPLDSWDLFRAVNEVVRRRMAPAQRTPHRPDSVKAALAEVRTLQDELLGATGASKRSVILEFKSSGDLNRFAQEALRFKNARIADVQVFENKYVVSVVVRPKSIEVIPAAGSRFRR